MFAKKISTVQFVLIQAVILQTLAETEFFLVSTTQRPPDLPNTASLNSQVNMVEEMQNKLQILDKIEKEHKDLALNYVKLQARIMELENANLENFQRVEKENQDLLVRNAKLQEKIESFEKLNLIWENAARLQNIQLQSCTKLLQDHTELTKRLQSAENEAQAQLHEARKQILDKVQTKYEDLSLDYIKLEGKVAGLEKTNSLSQNVTQIQNRIEEMERHYKGYAAELELVKNVTQKQSNSCTKLFQNHTEQIDNLQTTIAKLLKKGPASSCKDIKKNGNNLSGVYTIKPKWSSPNFQVWCDMETKDGGWIYVINRFDGSQDFNLNWTDYRNGFGNLSAEFWLGLEHLYELTGTEPTELLIELSDWDNKTVYANYKRFSVGSEKEGYKLNKVREVSGDAGNNFGLHQGSKFSTADRNNGDIAGGNPAVKYGGGWWYTDSYYCLFTGPYSNSSKPKYTRNSTSSGINYGGSFRGFSYSLKQVKMMIRPYT